MLEKKDESPTRGNGFSIRKYGVAARNRGKHFSFAIVPTSQLNTLRVYSSQNICYGVATLNYFISLPL
jgi:hypothetical protein